jgi:hypothetical protein
MCVRQAGHCFCASGKAQISTAQIWLRCTLARSTSSFLHNCEPTASYVYCCNMHVHIGEHANFRMKMFWWGHGKIIGAVQKWDIPLFVKFLWGNLAQLQLFVMSVITCGQVEQRWIWHVSSIVFCGVDDSVQSMRLILSSSLKQSATSADHRFYTSMCTMVFSTEKADQHLFITFFRSEVLLLFGEVWNWKIKSGMCVLTCIAMKVFHCQRQWVMKKSAASEHQR